MVADRYARMRAEHRSLLKSRAASLKGSSAKGVAREAGALIAELEAHLERERRENAAHQRALNERLYQQEQQQCDWCAPTAAPRPPPAPHCLRRWQHGGAPPGAAL